jgi:Asp-tRNA(Asn)/Glu-tRNA(Gln) amidotransferase B subunit
MQKTQGRANPERAREHLKEILMKDTNA